MVDTLCAIEFLLLARNVKVNNIEDETEGPAEFTGDQKRCQIWESRWLPRGVSTELDLDGCPLVGRMKRRWKGMPGKGTGIR